MEFGRLGNHMTTWTRWLLVNRSNYFGTTQLNDIYFDNGIPRHSHNFKRSAYCEVFRLLDHYNCNRTCDSLLKLVPHRCIEWLLPIKKDGDTDEASANEDPNNLRHLQLDVIATMDDSLPHIKNWRRQIQCTAINQWRSDAKELLFPKSNMRAMESTEFSICIISTCHC